jgi:ABC-type nitrate/sulfonate/bicarbonate transport system substrate-binding protein
MTMDRRSFLGKFAATTAGIGLGLGSLPSARAQKSLGKITVILATAPPDPNCHYFYYARDNGFYKEAGVEVDIKPVNSDPTAVRTVVSGAGDVAWAGASSTLQAIQAGSDLKVISCFSPHLDYSLVASKKYPDLKSLSHGAIAISQPGAISQIVPKLMIEHAGGNTSQARWLSVGGSSSRVQALIAHRCDAAALTSAFVARSLKYDFLHVVGDAIKDLPDLIYSWEIASESALHNKRAALQAFTTANARAVRWAMHNPDKAEAISRKVLPSAKPEDIHIATQVFKNKQYFSPTGKLAQSAWDYTVDQAMKAGDLKKPLKYSDIVLTEFVDAESKALGPYKP